MDYQTLKTRQRAERDNHPTNVSLRVHRALSWLNRAGQYEALKSWALLATGPRISGR